MVVPSESLVYLWSTYGLLIDEPVRLLPRLEALADALIVGMDVHLIGACAPTEQAHAEDIHGLTERQRHPQCSAAGAVEHRINRRVSREVTGVEGEARA